MSIESVMPFNPLLLYLPPDPIDCSPSGSPVLGILQARTLEWVAMPSSRRSSPPRDQTRVFFTVRQVLGHYATWEAPRRT